MMGYVQRIGCISPHSMFVVTGHKAPEDKVDDGAKINSTVLKNRMEYFLGFLEYGPVFHVTWVQVNPKCHNSTAES